MKNKKKALNPNKFWYYSGYLPKTTLTSGNYLFNYKIQNQLTIFMENLMTRNFNLLIKKIKKNKLKYRKYLYYFFFNKIYLNFIKILIYKYKTHEFLIKYLFFYLNYLNDYILMKKINIRSQKARVSKKKKKKKIKEHYLRAVPKYFKEFYFIKKSNFSFFNTDYYSLYCLNILPAMQTRHIKFMSRNYFIYILKYYEKFSKQQIFLNWMLKVFILDYNSLLYYQKNCIFSEKKKIRNFFFYWSKKKINLLLYYNIGRLSGQQIQLLLYVYYYFKYKHLIKKKKQKFSLTKHICKQIIKKNQYQFWYIYKGNKKKAFKKLVRMLKILLFFFKKNNKNSYIFFKFILLDPRSSSISYLQFMQSIYLQQQYTKYCQFLVRLKKKNIHDKKIFLYNYNIYNVKKLTQYLKLLPINYLRQSPTFRVYQIKLFQLLFIQKYLENFFIKLLQTPILIRFINLFFLQTQVSLFKKVITSKSHGFKKSKFFVQGIKAFLGGFYFNDPFVIAKHIAFRLQQTGRRQKHTTTINEIFYLLRLMKTLGFDLSGFQILLCGKINAKTQTKVKYLKWGPDLRTNTFSYPLHYIKTQVVTYTGVFGIHIWFIK